MPLVASGVFTKDILVKGKPSRVECINVAGQTYSLSGRSLTIARLEDEWYEDVTDPDAVIEAFRQNQHCTPDIFTFWQRLPDLAPRFRFHMEWDHIAALPVKSYDDWFSHCLKSRIRTSIRKSEKEGLIVKEALYDDAFVEGMTTIFNEAPFRQGRRFWHYGKDFETVKRQFSRYVHREYMIGAYYKEKMVGFMMVGDAGSFLLTSQIISSIEHRDKATNTAMIAKAVELCEKRRLGHLVYIFWREDSLTEFKRRCGFEKTDVPRFYVPLTLKGKMALKFGLHRGVATLLPAQIKSPLKNIRRSWYERLSRDGR